MQQSSPVGHTGHDPDGDVELAATHFEADHRRPGQLFRSGQNFAQTDILRRLRAQLEGVVPGQLGDRLGTFLEPAVVGGATVERGRIGPEDQLDLAGGFARQGARRGGDRAAGNGHGFNRGRGSGHYTVVQTAAPETFEGATATGGGEVSLPGFAHQLHHRSVATAEQRRDHRQRRLGVVEGINERLDQGRGTVESAQVTPRLEVVRFGDVPVAIFGGFVAV